MSRTNTSHEPPPSENPQSREHRGSQDVDRGPEESPLEGHDERSNEYGAHGAHGRPRGRDEAHAAPVEPDDEPTGG